MSSMKHMEADLMLVYAQVIMSDSNSTPTYEFWICTVDSILHVLVNIKQKEHTKYMQNNQSCTVLKFRVFACRTLPNFYSVCRLCVKTVPTT